MIWELKLPTVVMLTEVVEKEIVRKSFMTLQSSKLNFEYNRQNVLPIGLMNLMMKGISKKE